MGATKAERVELDRSSRVAHREHPVVRTDRYIWIVAPCAHVFALREDETPGYLAGVRVVLFACAIVGFVELLLALVLQA